MSERPSEEGVRQLFGLPSVYLRNDAHIEVRVQVLRELLGAGLRGRMLDMGCGDGRLSLQFLADSPGLSVSLVDLSPSMLDIARARVPPELAARVDITEASLATYQAEPFDFVLCIGVLAHVPDLAQALERLAGLTGPGGRLVLQITDEAQPLTRVYGALRSLKRLVRKQTPYEHTPTTRDDIRRVVEGRGLRLEVDRPHWILPPFAGVLPVDASRRLLEAASHRPALARFGTDRMLLFRRPA